MLGEMCSPRENRELSSKKPLLHITYLHVASAQLTLSERLYMVPCLINNFVLHSAASTMSRHTTAMSAMSESTSDDSNLGTENSSTFVHTTESFNYTVTHIFFPVHLPYGSNYTLKKDVSLARAVCATAHAYTSYVRGTPEEDQWHRITKMLDNLLASAQLECLNKGHIISQLLRMQTGGMFTIAVNLYTHADHL